MKEWLNKAICGVQKTENFKKGIYYLGDSRELIKEVPTESVDLILTDPPFGLKIDEYDNDEIFFELEDELWRVLKPNRWLVFYYSVKKLLNITKIKRFEYVWQIICEFSSTFSKCVLGDRKYIPILVFRKGNPKISYRRYDILPAGELPFVYEKVRDPQFKPTITTSLLLQMFSKEEELVFDPFAGYGSIPIVCEYFNRRWMAFEIDKRKYDIGVKFIREDKVGRIPSGEEERRKQRNFNDYIKSA